MSDRHSAIPFRQFESQRRKRLVEECIAITVGAVRRRFGKEVLLSAIKACQPIEVPISYRRPFEIWLTYDLHPLVNQPGKWSTLENGTARIWFMCAGCRRPVAKLFYYTFPGSTMASDLLCRRCHNLTYLSVNCAGNRFYKRVVKPYRRLRDIEERLRFRSLAYIVRRNLEAEKAALEVYLRRAMIDQGRKSQNPQRRVLEPAMTGTKRTYKALSLA